MNNSLFEEKTKHGIDKLKLMLYFMRVVESKGSKQLRSSFTRLKSFICQQIKRGITPHEELNLNQAILDYIKADGGTNERLASMDYLFDSKFLDK